MCDSQRVLGIAGGPSVGIDGRPADYREVGGSPDSAASLAPVRRPPAFSSRRVKIRQTNHSPDETSESKFRLQKGNVNVTIRQ
jgi:hypothetical protein